MPTISFFKKHWLASLAVLLVGLPLIGAVVGSAILLAYIYWPNQFDSIDFSRFATEKSQLAILAHGVRDNTTSWISPLLVLYRNNGFAGDVLPVDWSKYAGSSLTCAVEGKRIGELIGQRVARSSDVRAVHLIGHSCGAFVVYGACMAIKEKRPDIVVQATYLDPVSVYGPFWNYGLNHFGYCTDYSEAYIDTEDDVPGSNRLVPNTHTYNVTAARTPDHFDVRPHNWPTIYYRKLVEMNRQPELWRDRNLPISRPPGVLETIE